MPNNKLILYGGIGVAVVVAIIIAFIMMRKEGFNNWANEPTYTTLSPNITPSSPSNVTLANPKLKNLTNSYTPATGVMGSAPYAQSGSFMVESDLNGNISSSASLPIGAIIIWYGSKNVIPVGWVLCDGNNGTPPLNTNNFPSGASNDATIGTIGGLTSTPLPSHDHYVYTLQNGPNPFADALPDVDWYSGDNSITIANQTIMDVFVGSNGSASNSVPTTYTGSGSGDIPTMPPYVGVYYIMKIQ